jgi:hypothetical protein
MPREHGGETDTYNTSPFPVYYSTRKVRHICVIDPNSFFSNITQGVDLTGPKKRNARLRLYSFMMADFSEEQKIQVTAKIVQDMLSYAVDYLRSNNRYSLPAAIFSFLLLHYHIPSLLRTYRHFPLLP